MPSSGRSITLRQCYVPPPTVANTAADAAGVDEIVVGGDVVLGPMPRETLELLLALGARARFLRGNCDRLVVDAFDGRIPSRLPPAVQESIAWTARQLDRRHRDTLAAWPESLTVAVPGLGDVLFCHATPRSDEEVFTAVSPAERVRPMLAGVTQPVVVCGHTHMQFDRMVDEVRVLNAGSVGMPFAPPGAYWLLLDADARLVRTEYDRARAEERVRATSYPQPDEVLNPFSAEQAMGFFEPQASSGS